MRWAFEGGLRIAGYFVPDVPTIERFPTLPRRRRSNIVRPTTPTFLSLPEAPPPTKPVVYSPVPTMRTFNGFKACSAGLGAAGAGWRGMASIVFLACVRWRCDACCGSAQP